MNLDDGYSINEDWKDFAKTIPKATGKHLAKIVCIQTNCLSRGLEQAPFGVGRCATCADTAECVVREYMRLTK